MGGEWEVNGRWMGGSVASTGVGDGWSHGAVMEMDGRQVARW